jgi:hypothetical protein
MEFIFDAFWHLDTGEIHWPMCYLEHGLLTARSRWEPCFSSIGNLSENEAEEAIIALKQLKMIE